MLIENKITLMILNKYETSYYNIKKKLPIEKD